MDLQLSQVAHALLSIYVHGLPAKTGRLHFRASAGKHKDLNDHRKGAPMKIVANATARSDWLIPNYGNRCTLVAAASALQLLGAESHTLVEAIEREVHFVDSFGPWITDYLHLPGFTTRLDRGIECAAREGGIAVRARTRLFWSWRAIIKHLEADGVVVLNCWRAPGGHWSHSVIAIGFADNPPCVLTVNPNNGELYRKYRWLPSSGSICTVTFISLAAARR